jgi:hypothetical protein
MIERKEIKYPSRAAGVVGYESCRYLPLSNTGACTGVWWFDFLAQICCGACIRLSEAG